MLRKLKKTIVAYLNNKSLVVKFIAIFVVCVFMPILLSCIIFSYNINRNFYEREMDNLSFMVKSESYDLSSVFDEAVAISNVIANDNVVHEIAEMRFISNVEYYDYLTEHSIRDYFSTYISQKDSIEDTLVYIDNDTIMDGEIIRMLTALEKDKDIYQRVMDSSNNIILCMEQNVKSPESELQDSYVSNRFCFVRKLYRGKTGSNIFGYIKISLNMEKLKKLMAKDSDYMSFYFVNEEDDIVYDPSDGSFHSGDGFMPWISSGRYNLTYSEDFANISYLDNWSITGVYDKSRLVEKCFENIIMVILVNIFIGIMMVFVVYMVYCSYNDRISKLGISMHEVEKENFYPVEGDYGRDEIGGLTYAYNHMINRINLLINDVYQLEIKNKSIEVERIRAELRALQSQVNPHFLFNVLNAILVASVKNGYSQIVPQISCLSKMMRHLLDWSEDCEPLSSEMNFVETYLKLEKFRFGERFEYEIIMAHNADRCKIPKMIIQPLIENACRHGLQGLRGLKYVCVKSDLCGNILTVSVTDNGHGMTQDKLTELQGSMQNEDFTGHIGVKNVYSRLKLYFGDNADMQIDSEKDNGTEVIITIRYKDDEKNE